MRLPVEDSSPRLVIEDGLETSTGADLAYPHHVKLWEQYEDVLLDECIRVHAKKAGSTDRRCAAL